MNTGPEQLALMKVNPQSLCECGCHSLAPPGKRFILGHNKRIWRKKPSEVKSTRSVSAKEKKKQAHRLYFPLREPDELLGTYKVKKFLFFCSSYLTHVHGEFAGKRVVLMEWQKRIVEKVFGVLNPDGTRQHRRVILHVARKNGKSFLAAILLLYFLSEESFDDRAMEIVSVALSKVQSQGTVFKTCRMLVAASPELAQLIRILRAPASLTNLLTDAVYEPLSSDGKLQLGRNISVAVIDETHGLPSSEIWDSIATSQSLRQQPLLISVSTSGDSRGSFYYNSVYLRAKQILLDSSIDPTTAAFVYEVSDELNWKDPKNFPLANPALTETGEDGGFRPAAELHLALQEALETESESSFRMYYLNQFVQYGSRSFVALDRWDRCTNSEIDFSEMRDRRVVTGLDFSQTTDLTALSIIIEGVKGSKTWTCIVVHWLAGLSLSECEKRDKIHYQKFLNTGTLYFDGREVISIEQVMDVLSSLQNSLPGLKTIGFDPYLQSEISKLDKHFELIPIPQQFSFMSPPLKLLKAKILNKEIVHNGDLLLRTEIENVRITEDANGNIKADKSKSRSRIDGLIALAIGAAVAIKKDFRR